MKLFDGQTTLTVEKKETQCILFLTGTQVSDQDLEFIKSKITLERSEDEAYAFQITYPLASDTKSLQTVMYETKTELERLSLILQVKQLFVENSGYKIPFIHPQNIFFKDGHLTFLHTGIRECLAPMSFDSELALSQYKGLILSILNPKMSYDHFVDGEASLKDKFSQFLASCETFEAIQQLITAKLLKAKQKDEADIIKVSKTRYQFFKYAASVAIVAAVIMGVLTIFNQKTTIPKQKAIINAQANFITNHFDKTLTALKTYQPSQRCFGL